LNEDISAIEDTISPEHRAFAIAYVSNGYDHKAAAKTAGFHPDLGVSLKYRPDVVGYVKYLQNKLSAETIVGRQYLDVYLDKLQDIALGNTPVPMVTGQGESFSACRFMEKLAMEVYKERVKLHDVLVDQEPTSTVVIKVLAPTEADHES
jgi:hypothetical protein